VSGSQGGRDCNPLVLEAMGARLHGRFVGFDGARALFNADLDASIEYGTTFERKLCQRFDDYAKAAELDLPEHEPLVRRGSRPNATTELTLKREGITTVLWAGGFRPAFQWIDIPVFDEMGFPRADAALLARPDSPSLDSRGYTRASRRCSSALETTQLMSQTLSRHISRRSSAASLGLVSGCGRSAVTSHDLARLHADKGLTIPHADQSQTPTETDSGSPAAQPLRSPSD
jgi:hypothetical protein